MRRVFYAVGLAVALSASASAQVNYTTNGTSGERLDALSECASLAVAGYGKASIDVVATPSFTGTLTFYVIGPGGTQTAVNSTPPNSTTAVTTTTAAGQWGADVAGKTGLRACFTAYTSGAATVYLSASSAGGGSSGGGGGGAGTSDTTEATQLSVLAAVDGLETNTAATLTSANFAAAFGTAGTADTQVMSVQGIASGTALTVSASNLDVQIGGSDTVTVSATNLDIQSGGADVATQATLASVLTEQTAAAATLSDIEAALAADATHGSAVIATGPQGQLEAKDIDGGALPNVVTEGQAARAAGTLSGATIVTLVNEAGTADIGASILTSVQLTDDVVGVEDVAETADRGLAMVGTVRRTAAASSAGAGGDNATLNTDTLGLLWTRTLDPCSGVAKSYYVINNATASSNNEIANAVAGEFWYICSINLVAAGAQTFLLAHDDSDSCGSLTAGMNGGTTAGTGWSFAANGGIALGNGSSTVMKSATANHYLCYAIGQSVQTSGTIAYVSAP